MQHPWYSPPSSQPDTWLRSGPALATRLEQLLLEKCAVEAAADHPLTTALGQASDAVDASAVKDMVAHMTAPGWPPRRHDNGLAGAAAMPPRLRREPSGSAPPCLPLACKLCEASYPTAPTLRWPTVRE